MRAGVAVVPGVLVDGCERYVFRLGEVWRPSAERTAEENLRHGVEHYNRWLEAEVRRAPENYFWAHRRWKSRPPETSPVAADAEPGGGPGA